MGPILSAFKIPALVIEHTAENEPAGVADPEPDRETFRGSSGQIAFYCWSQGEELWLDVPRVAKFRMACNGTCVTGLPSEGAGHELVRDAFHRIALPMMIQAAGLEVLHGSAIRIPTGVVAFCADAGRGKSTTAFAMSERGYQLWADDAVAVEVTDEHPCSVWLPFRPHLTSESFRFFEQRRSPVWSSLARSPFSEGERAPLRAIFLLERASGQGGKAYVRRLDQITALPALLEHAFCFELARTERKGRMALSYLALATRVPVFSLEFEPGLEWMDQILAAIEGTIHEHWTTD